MESGSLQLRRYSAAAWLLAVAVSLLAIGIRVSDRVGVALAFIGLALAIPAAVYWLSEKAALHIARKSAGQADAADHRQRLLAHTAVVVLWLYNGLLLMPLLLVYPDPRINRLHAEPLGFELVFPLGIAVVGCVAVTLLVLLARRALASPSLGRYPLLRALSIVAPIALALAAWAPHLFYPEVQENWGLSGGDLPEPTLIVIGTYRFWGILPAFALCLAAIVLVSGNRGVRARVAGAGLVGLLIAGSLLLSLAVSAIYLPLFKMCGNV